MQRYDGLNQIVFVDDSQIAVWLKSSRIKKIPVPKLLSAAANGNNALMAL